MPQIGSCTDLTCDKEIKHLYECHCCSRFICLNHLIEHVEITKRNKERLDSLSNELIKITAALKLIIEKKLLDIERENKLIEQAKELVNVRIGSIDEIQIIFEEINHAIALNRSEEAIVKVESSLIDIKNCSCVCTCDNNKNSQNDELPFKTIRPESKSPICLDLTSDTDQAEKLVLTNVISDDKYSMCDDREFIDHISIDQTADFIEDEDNEQNKVKPRGTTSLAGRCPLTFDGAYGLTEAQHSVRFCSTTKNRSRGLYGHFINAHELKPIYARRLVQAIANKHDAKTTKIFDENEDVINHFHRIPCPFNNGMIDLFGYSKKNISRVPCGNQSIIVHSLKFHLRHYHNVSDNLARTLAAHFKETRMKNHLS